MSAIDQRPSEPAVVVQPTKLLLRRRGVGPEKILIANEAALDKRAIITHEGVFYTYRSETQISGHGWVRVYFEAEVVRL